MKFYKCMLSILLALFRGFSRLRGFYLMKMLIKKSLPALHSKKKKNAKIFRRVLDWTPNSTLVFLAYRLQLVVRLIFASYRTKPSPSVRFLNDKYIYFNILETFRKAILLQINQVHIKNHSQILVFMFRMNFL